MDSIDRESCSYIALKMDVFGDPMANLPKACEEIGVTVKRFNEDVAVVKYWMQSQPHLPKVDNTLIVENMLLRCKGSVEVAKQTIDRFFSVRGRFPDLFTVTDPCSPEMVLSHQLRKMTVLEDLTQEGHRIIMTTLPDPKHLEQFKMSFFVKYLLLNADLLTGEDISSGVIYILDVSKVSLAHSTWMLKNFDILQKSMTCIFKAYKARVKAIHFLNPPPSFNSLLKLIVKVVPKKVEGRCFVHAGLDTLHQHFRKEILPKDFGGNQKEFLELADKFHEDIKAHRQWFLDHEKSWLTDESKRPADSISAKDDSFGFDGTFKKLEVD